MRNVVSYTNHAVSYVPVVDIKTHLRILDTDEDAFLEQLINAAFDIASEYVGYSIRKASVEHWFSSAPMDKLTIYARVLSVTSVHYVDEDGTLTAITYNTYGSTYSKFGYTIELTDSADDLNEYGNKYKVVLVEGFELPSASVNDGFKFPDAIRSAIYMIVANLYENRQDDTIGVTSSPIPMNSKFLLNPYKVDVFV